jgi:hypothetical protein
MSNAKNPDGNTTVQRRGELRSYAQTALAHPNQCQALVNIVSKAAELVDGVPNPARTIVEDLQYVLIGNDLLEGRGKGAFFVGYKNKSGKFYWRGARGFKKELRDSSHQIQHAVAGIVIGYRYSRPVQWLVKWIEEEPQDDRLYDATFPLGRDLNDKNYKELAKKLERTIGHGTKK